MLRGLRAGINAAERMHPRAELCPPREGYIDRRRRRGPLRRRDGFHLTQQGAEVVWERIRAKTVAALRQRAAPTRAPGVTTATHVAVANDATAAGEAAVATSGRRAELDALVARMLGQGDE